MFERTWMAGAAACALLACGPSTETPQKDVGDLASTALVAPAPSGTDDTSALQAALNGCIPGGPTCVVQLRTGTYKTKQLYANGFHGTLAGAGMGATKVVPSGKYAMKVGGELNDPYALAPDPVTNPQPHIMTFFGGSDVRVQDLTFEVEAANPTEEWLYGCPVQALKAAVSVTGSARFDRVEFRGQATGTTWAADHDDGRGCVDFVGANVDNGPMLSSSKPGEEFAIRASRFKGLGNGFETYLIDHASVVVGGSPKDGNTFDAGSNAGLFLNTITSRVHYSWNRSTNSLAPGWHILPIWNVGGPEYDGVSTFLVEHNTFSGSGEGMNAVYVQDRPGRLGKPKTLDLAFLNNVVDVHDAWAGGLLLIGLEAPMVVNNAFTGEGAVGIFVELTRNAGGTGGQLLTNDLSRFTPTPDIDPPGAPIVLLGESHDVLVNLAGQATSVVDLGTNNRIVGAKSAGH